MDLAFGLDLIEADTDSIRLRFINADGYYLYKHRFAFNSDHPQVTIGTRNGLQPNRKPMSISAMSRCSTALRT